jgi:putative ABC transport system permease protein
MITEFLTRIRFLIFRKKVSDFEHELQFHLEQSIAQKIAEGLSTSEARRQALIEFGGLERTREQCDQQRPGWWLSTVLQDARYAMRGFRRNPLFTGSVVVTLALGIGATTAVFSVVDRILFRALPYADPGRIVSLGIVHSLEHQEFLMGRFYLEWQDNQKSFVSLASQSTGTHPCDLVENNPAQLDCVRFQADFLPLFGISPVLGRNFLPEEDRPNGPLVVMISYALWKGHFSGDPHILERAINIDGSEVHVVGVLPRNFQFPTLASADVIFPMALNRTAQHTINGGFGDPMRTFARLKAGVSIAQAYAQMQPLFDSERQLFPAEARDEARLSIRSLRDRETIDVRSVAWILLGSVLAVLLIGCANVASLMMARGAARQRELAVRSALGASRSRLIRQTLTEAILLSLSGAVAGLAVAQGLLAVFIKLAPTGVPFLGEAHLDLRIAMFTVSLALICGALFGFATALQKPSSAVLNARTSVSRSHVLLRRSFVMGQIAVSIILVSGAALLLRSFQKIQDQNLGMQTGGVLTVKPALPWFRYNTDEKEMQFYLHLESTLRRLPGTRAVGMADCIPPGGWQGEFRFSDLAVEGRAPSKPGTGVTVVIRRVTPDYFPALNIPIIRGPGFAEAERTSPQNLVVLSKLLAAQLFPGADPIGRRIQIAHQTADDGTWFNVAGVANNVKNGGLTDQDDPEIYVLRRNVSVDWAGSRSILLIDSVFPTTTIGPWVRSQITALDRTVPVDMEPLTKTISGLADRPRFETALLGFFAFTGLVLAVIGLYGVIAYMATQRTQEIGVRMALGATRSDILHLIAKDGVRLVLAGGVIGLGAALAVSRLLKALLFQVSTYDPLTFIAVPMLLCLVSLVAILIPARAGMRVDPAVALRNE